MLTGFLSDKCCVRLFYLLKTRRWLNLSKPLSFNEKLQWLKLNNRRPEYTKMVDKVEVKDYVASCIGEECIIQTLGVYDEFEDVDFDKLPNQFVLKCTHDSGSIFICKNKQKLDKKLAYKIIGGALKRNYYKISREWPYKNVKPRIIAEDYLTDGDDELKDYKIYNFNGEPKLIQVDYSRFHGHKRNLYTIDWKRINAEIQYPSDKDKEIPMPKKLDTMLMMARKLSYGKPFLRTDFYVVNDRIYFGELTFFPEGGVGKIRPESFEYQLGQWIGLPKLA